MDKEYIEKKIKEVKENIVMCEENIKNATLHKEEGELILQALNDRLKTLK